jgi:adenylosuccinate synthase
MPVTVVIGGQFGSEGKGKVAAIVAREQQATAVVRVGGPNSGHTPDGPELRALQQLPTAAYERDVICVLPPGSYISPQILWAEIELTGLNTSRLKIDPAAAIITAADCSAEIQVGITKDIGSTGSGTGAAVWRRAMRTGGATFARDIPELRPYLRDTASYMRGLLDRGRRIVIEGTQGFGLSVLHGGYYPYATSRDTTAAGALSEAGLSPLDVDNVTLVIRACPIRVAGSSGPLPNETGWDELTRLGRHDHDLVEKTTVTRRVRRVANFHPDVVIRALAANRPTTLVMNHLDYLDHDSCASQTPTAITEGFITTVEKALDRRIDRLGLGPYGLTERSAALVASTKAIAVCAP